MRRTTPLTATAMLGLALLAPTTSASAAGEACRGEAATIVGTGDRVVGTEGRDVIVTGRASEVRSLGGDDLVCVVADRTGINVLDVDTGAGNDVVDTTSATLTGYYVETHLGAGTDTLEGGAGGDWVTTDDTSGATEVDVVETGGGDDYVTTAGASDVVELGPGNNTLILDGPGTTAQGRLAGGEGYDTFGMTVEAPGEHAYDLAAGTFRSPHGSADFSSFESLNLLVRGATARISGTDGDDHVVVRSDRPARSVVVADLLGGDDDLLLDDTPLGAGSRIDLGTGEDRLVAAREKGRLGLDLVVSELRTGSDVVRALGIEDAFLMARTVGMVGDEQDNTLSSLACTTGLVGGRGDDELIWQGDDVFEDYHFTCPKTVTMRGGPGDDSFFGSNAADDRLLGGGGDDTVRGQAGDDRVRGGAGADKLQGGAGDDDVRGGGGADRLFGNEGRDVLIGNSGRDLAAGGPGRDRCVAEREQGCER